MKILATKAEFDEIIAQDGRLVVIDFYATWCPPCKAIAPVLEKLAEKYTDVVFAKVDVDQNSKTSEDCNVNCMPTFQFYKNGKKVDNLEGASAERLEEKIKKHM